MSTSADQDLQATLDRIEKIESPVARRVIGSIARGLFAGKLTGNDMEILAGVAERIADRSESSLNEDELSLVQAYRQLNESQRQGALMLLNAVKSD